MRTNTPPTGAFRGFGAPQSQFAAEVHMERIAAALDLDPIELRRRNLFRPGDETATGQVLRDSVSAAEALERALARHKKAQKRAGKPPKRDGLRRATGLAMFFHGSGFTGAGEVKLASRAGVELTKKGVRILCGSTEIGQGTRTMHAQIVADALGIPYDWVETMDPDTAVVPDSGPTVASRTCMVVGKILERAATTLREELGDYRTPDEFRRAARRYLDEHQALRCIEQYARPADLHWDEERYRGDAYGAYAWGCNIADVEVDPITYQARCTRITAAIDIGKAIHPLLVEGQIEGGTLQGVGWALYEDVVMREGRMQNASLTNYIIPTTMDTPEMHVELIENPYAHGPSGAKGVGECPIDGPAAAIANALSRALATPVDEIPATPERLMKLLGEVQP